MKRFLITLLLTLTLLIASVSADAIDTVRGFNYINEGGLIFADNRPLYFGSGSGPSAGVYTADVKITPDGTNLVITGSGGWNFGGSTGAFILPTGTFTLTNGAVVAANKSITYAAGSGGLDASLGTGPFKTSSGTNTLYGDVVINGAKNFTVGTGATVLGGTLDVDGNTDLDLVNVSETLDVATADKLTVGGVIIPQEAIITVQISASSVDENIFIASDAWQVTHIEEVHAVAGNDASPVNLTVKKCTGTEAPDAGDNLLQAVIDLKGTVNTVQAGNITGITEAYLQLADGDRLAIDYDGNLTTLAGGSVTVHMKRI